MTNALLLLLSLSANAQEAPADEPVVESEEGEAAEGTDAEAPAAEDDAPAAEEEEAPPRWPKRWEGQVDESDPHWDLELLYLDGKFDEGLAEAKRQQAANPQDGDLYWHIVRFGFEVGEKFERTDTSIDKEAHYAEMQEWADKGLEVDPDNTHIRFARGIAMGRLGTTRGVLSSLFMAKDIERDWLATTESSYRYSAANGNEILPCDAHQALGIFYRLVPEWWIVGVIAGTKGDIGKSVEHLSKASKCVGTPMIRNLKELGVAQICYGQRRKDQAVLAQGIGTLSTMVAMPPVTDTEKIDIKHGHMLIADPDLACEYSRDGQQDLDEEKLEK